MGQKAKYQSSRRKFASPIFPDISFRIPNASSLRIHSKAFPESLGFLPMKSTLQLSRARGAMPVGSL